MEGHLDKMRVLEGNPIDYYLRLDNEEIHLNPLIGKNIKIEFLGKIHCKNCHEETKKPFSGGYCYPCSIKLAVCDICILKPELCHYHKGTCREPKWGEEHCMIDHYIYLANTSGLKVGITRYTQLPTRWIDQGAISALPILKVKSRYQSGLFEKIFSKILDDKTNWREMLKSTIKPLNLVKRRDLYLRQLSTELDSLEKEIGVNEVTFLENEKQHDFNYPVLSFPEKITAVNLLNENKIEGVLMGIKGQYLIFEKKVINIRNHTSFLVSVNSEE